MKPKRIRHPSPSVLTDSEQSTILANHHNTPVLQFMKQFKRGAKIIYEFLDNNNITPYQTVPGRPKTRQDKQTEFFEFDKEWII